MRTALVMILMTVGTQLTLAQSMAAQSMATVSDTDLNSAAVPVRRQAALRLATAPAAQAVPLLAKALQDSDGSVRAAAARSLGCLRDAHAVPPLLAALADSSTSVRFYAADSLGQIADPRAVDGLIASMSDSQWCVRNQAAWALTTMDDPTVCTKVVDLLRRDHADVPLVIWILKRLGVAAVEKQLVDCLTTSGPRVRQQAARILAEVRPPGTAGALITALNDSDPAVRCAAISGLVKLRVAAALEPLKKLAQHESDKSVAVAARQALTQLSRRDDLLACWNFDSGGTAAVRDTTGNGNDGEMHGGVIVPSKHGLGLQLDGKSFVELGQPPAMDFSNGPLTVMAWTRTAAPNGVVIAKGGKSCGFSLYVKDEHAAFGIHCTAEGPTYVARSPDPVTGRWSHLAGVIREDRIELFVDGKLAATTKTDGYIPGNCGQGLEIGFDAGNSPAEITSYFVGIIDEVKVLRAALNAPEVTAQMGDD